MKSEFHPEEVSKPECKSPKQHPAPGYRQIEVFRMAYEERDFTAAGVAMNSGRKSVLRSVRSLEAIARSPLFIEQEDGTLLPTPFGEGLYNDTNHLARSFANLKTRAEEIRSVGRELRIGSCSLVFRTLFFQRILRYTREEEHLHANYVPFTSALASKALQQGDCDLFLTMFPQSGERLRAEKIADIPFRTYTCGTDTHVRNNANDSTVFELAGPDTEIPAKSGRIPLSVEQWAFWLEHPRQCPEGTQIFAPSVVTDSRFWQESAVARCDTRSSPLYAIYLHNHPYEFLPRLCGQFKSKTFLKNDP